jgi:mRNA interferase MazF
VILCQITSQAREDVYSVRLEASDFVNGGLSLSSRIRPNRLFTADSNIVVYRAGQINSAKLKETREKLMRILSD